MAAFFDTQACVFESDVSVCWLPIVLDTIDHFDINYNILVTSFITKNPIDTGTACEAV
jgi:hypothetical protein